MVYTLFANFERGNEFKEQEFHKISDFLKSKDRQLQ